MVRKKLYFDDVFAGILLVHTLNHATESGRSGARSALFRRAVDAGDDGVGAPAQRSQVLRVEGVPGAG